MSMELTTILEFIRVFIAYGILVLLAPYIVCNKYLKSKTLHQRFIICTLIGNFYMINIVFLMFILHIPNRISLYILSIVPAVVAWYRINHPDVKGFFLLIYTSITRLFLGEAKIRTLWNVLSHRPKRFIRKSIRNFFSHAGHHLLEWGMLLSLLGYNIYYYGYQTVVRYSYGTSDIVVHHFWVNQMDEGQIFCKGIYPFGFHNVIYFIHNFFDIPLVSIFRVFGVVETLFIYMMLYILLRTICRSRYIPIIGLLIFTLPNLFETQGIMRYQFSLPQEFGMIFLYPCAYFLIQYFRRKRAEIAKEKELTAQKKLYTWLELYHFRPSTRSLVLFAISFSLTLSAHFYITIIAFILCFAIAMAYFPVVFHYRYFCSIAVAGILSLFSAVAPMAVFFIGGTPLQGSLGWALEVIADNSDKAKASEDDKQMEKYKVSDGDGYVVYDVTDADPSLLATPTPVPQTSAAPVKELSAKEQIIHLGNKIRNKFISVNKIIIENLKHVYLQKEFIYFLLYGAEIMFLLCILLILIRRKFYYRNLLSAVFYLLLLILLFCASDFSLPSPMDQTRIRIFAAYAAPLFVACVLDLVYVIICRPFRYHKFTEVLPIALGAAMTYLIIAGDFIKPLSLEFAIMSSGEMRCNYEIMKNYPEKKWTVVTSTNSLQIVREKGWHSEMCTFLGDMHKLTDRTTITIPTQYVFFYIEKYPIQYGASNSVKDDFLNLGYISMEEAEQPAVYTGSEAYSIENRKILESKMFYWAKAFQAKYPQEFQVYYEDETFICYRIVQNEYSLYNFAIDYGYN